MILTINVGSASIKFALYHDHDTESPIARGACDRIGFRDGQFRVDDAEGRTGDRQTIDLPDFPAAIRYLFDWLPTYLADEPLAAIGHRVVHGGRDFTEATRLTPDVLTVLKLLVPFAPNHLPMSLTAIETAMAAFPAIPQIACFDTAFHRTMPDVAKRYGLPRSLDADGIQRYGFHGLSYQYIVEELERLDATTRQQRIVIAHLGNGASLCAVRNGQSVDTTMGLTPLSGLIMGTRCGDIDPEIPLLLAAERGMTTEEIRDLLAHQSGLKGISGHSADVRDLLASEASDRHAAEAIESFCYAARKGIAAMTAAMDGIDTLVFTGGIGTHAPTIRERTINGLSHLGIEIADPMNTQNAPVISTPISRVTVRVLPTNEEKMLARQTAKLING